MTDFLTRYRTAVTGRPDAPLVFLGNFEVENRWAIGERGLPRQFSAGRAVANRMDEFALLLAGPGDHVVLKAEPDRAYLDHLRRLGIELPTVLAVGGADPQSSVSDDALADPGLPDLLSRLAAGGALLAPHGISDLEEKISATCGLPLAGPSAAVCKSVNSKVYSRRLADSLGLRQPAGRACSTVDELDEAVDWAGGLLGAGRTVVVKDAFGVSGKGIIVVTPADGAHRLDRLRALVTRPLRHSDDQRIGIVVEEWVAKSIDLSCQVTIAVDGSSCVDFVKEAVIDDGVPKGHRMPARLSHGQQADLVTAAGALAERLAADGFYGVAGIDAMTDPDGGVYPMVEINARNNLSTYQASLLEQFMAPSQTALARLYPLRLSSALSFAELSRRLDGLLYDPHRGTGLLVNNFGTVNADAARLTAAEPATSVSGRLYGLLIEDDGDRAEAADRQVLARLADLLPTTS